MSEPYYIGIIGDGQLARMLIEQNKDDNIRFNVLPKEDIDIQDSSCFGLANFMKTYDELFENSNVVTFEYESFDVDYCISKGYETVPSLNCIKIIQNKYTQKQLYESKDLNVPKTIKHGTIDEIYKYLFDHYTKEEKEFQNKHSIWGIEQHFILKKDIGGYDGKGVFKLSKYTFQNILNELPKTSDTYYLEEYLTEPEEVSVIVAVKGYHVVNYEPCKLTMKEQKLDMLVNRLRSSEEHKQKFIDIATMATESFDTNGIFAVEMMYSNDTIYINEISPRPHNTGHHTIESTPYNQYWMLLNILKPTDKIPIRIKERVCYLKNIYGPHFTGHYKVDTSRISKLGKVKMYGKKINKPGRKMGHITKTFDDEIMHGIDKEEWNNIDYLYNPIRATSIEIVMGSISDLDTVKPALDTLDELQVGYHVSVLSAHRMADEMYKFGKDLDETCTKVVIACAGGAAHLPGMLASMTIVPVIGLPAKSSALSGLDSLYSIVQMPRGVPVATVAIGNGVNAALLACRILAINNSHLAKRLKEYKQNMNQNAKETNVQLTSYNKIML